MDIAFLSYSIEEEIVSELENKIEFEFFQPEATPEIKILSSSQPEEIWEENDMIDSLVDDSEIFVDQIKQEPEKMDDYFLDEELQLSEPVIEEESIEIEEIVNEDDKYSEALVDNIELDDLKRNQMAWGYSNRIRTVIENHNSINPGDLPGGVEDSVIVEITLNREGQLINSTPYIPSESASRHESVNRLVCQFIIKASKFFPRIPKSYPKDSITFSVPIRLKH